MPLFDLSFVTSTLTSALNANILRLDPSLSALLTVSANPPERVFSAQNTVNLFLYHVAEDACFKNLPGNMSDARPVATKPMSLVLYYILTAHHQPLSSGVFDTQREQRLMGYALKTMHDFPVIDDRTQIAGVFLLPAELRGRENRLEINLRPLSPEDALSFWSAEDQHTARLSAYYEVRFVMLESEPPQPLPGIVLTVGTYLIDNASPQLAGSTNRLAFSLPPSAGGGSRTLEATPARASRPPVAPPDANRFELIGNNLDVGQQCRIYLRLARWAARGPQFNRVFVDFSRPANVAAGWRMALTNGRIELSLGTQLEFATTGPAVILPIEPGIYGVAIEVVKQSTVVAGRLREILDLSNETVLAVIPRIVGASITNPATREVRVDVNCSGLTPAPVPPGPLTVRLVVDGTAYTHFDPLIHPVFDFGMFQLQPDRVEFRALFDVTNDGEHTLRLLVEGAESQPYWISTP